MSAAPPPSPPAPDFPEAKPRLWTVGTLKYTQAGLLALCVLLLWGDFAMSMKDRSVAPVFQVVLHKFGASDALFAILISSVPAAIGMILGPIVAYKSDRHRGRWGRRIPFVFIPLPFVVFSMIGLGFSPILGTRLHEILGPGSPGLNSCVLATFGFFWVIFDFASVISGAVFGGLINDVVPSEVLGRFFGLWRAVSLIAGILFNHYLMKYAETYYLEIFLGTALLFGFGFGFVCLRLKEGDYPPPPPPGPHGALGFLYAAKGYLIECFGIRYYWWYFAATLFAGLSFSPVNLYNVPFADAMQAKDSYGDCLALTFTISLILAYPLGALVDRIHPLPTCLMTLVLYLLVTLWGGIFIHDTRTYEIALVLHGVISGIYFTTSASLGQRLLPRANFAQFASAGGILTSLCGIFIPPVIGMYLDHTGHIYRYTYVVGTGFTAISIVLLTILYLKFLKLGGPKNYVAPDRIP